MSNKVTKKTNKTQNLEQDVKEKEKEYEAIKEAIEKGNIDILTNFRLKNLKSTKVSTKVPKKLSEKEKEKRDEIRRLKEAEDLAAIQQKLFRQVKGRKKIEPLYNKKNLYTNADVFAANIEKECEKIFPNNEKSKKNEILKTENAILKNNKSTNNSNNISNNEKTGGLEKKNINKKFKINCENNNELDEKKDKEYLNKLDKDIEKFYMEKCGKIFKFLKDIHLVRYIDEFLKEGYDIYEDFIEFPEDYFHNKNNPFLNKSQQFKFYNKLHLAQNKYKPNNSHNNINQRENYSNNRSNGMDLNSINENNNINIKNNIKNSMDLNPINEDNNISINNARTNEFNDNIDINNNDNMNKTDNLFIIKKDLIINDINNKIILKDTSSKITKEDLISNLNIDELEKQREEEFKKAVENWRNSKSSRLNNTSYIPKNNLIYTEMGTSIKNPVPERKKKIFYCWNCYKQFSEGEGVSKEYNNNDLSSKYNMRSFCSSKCVKDYEKKKKSQYLCFECGKMFDLFKGFISFEGEKFCSVDCKNKFIQEQKESIKNYKKEEKKNKKEIEQKNKEKNENENEEDEENMYDPMDDF